MDWLISSAEAAASDGAAAASVSLSRLTGGLEPRGRAGEGSRKKAKTDLVFRFRGLCSDRSLAWDGATSECAPWRRLSS